MLSIPEVSGVLRCFTEQLLEENVKALFHGVYLVMGYFSDFCAFAPSINKQILSFVAPVTVPCAAR